MTYCYVYVQNNSDSDTNVYVYVYVYELVTRNVCATMKHIRVCIHTYTK